MNLKGSRDIIGKSKAAIYHFRVIGSHSMNAQKLEREE